MKKFTAFFVALVMILTCVATVACNRTVWVYLENYDGISTKKQAYNPDDPLPTPEREGYVFGGWYTDMELTKPFTQGTKMEDNFHLYAKWTAVKQEGDDPKTVTVTFHFCDGVTPDRTSDGTPGWTFGSFLPTGIFPPARKDYRFDGWYTAETGGTQMLSTTVIDVSMPVYAHWTYTGGSQGGDGDSVDLAKVFANYANPANWNFAVNVEDSYDNYTEHYEYLGYDVLRYYENNGYHTDYIGCDLTSGVYTYYYDNGDNTYATYEDDTDDFYEFVSYMYMLAPDHLSDYTFTASGNKFVADNPGACGNVVIGEYEGYAWTSVELYIANEQITKIVAVSNGGWTETYTFTQYGQISFTLPDVSGGSGTTTPTGVMEKQTYNPATFDNQRLQDKMLPVDGAIGLPSIGDYHALVVPVQFVGDTITKTQLDQLEKAFNGNRSDTGWESVQSYYLKSSYGKLKLTFDIQSVYQAKYNANRYANMQGGEEAILLEVLEYYENRLDLTQYDNNNDGTIDAVYLIYSAPVDYSDDSFYWAYVTWYEGQDTFDNLDAYYYLFAGFDFMDESTNRQDSSLNEYYAIIPGLEINANTFIHETGHLLGLDDYYDYDSNSGGNEGLGGADMMDYNVGDHNVYSKIMLGWITPIIVNETATNITLKSLQALSEDGLGGAILIPLAFNNSYFSEYLLIDLYTASGLNELHANEEYSYLYDGAQYGVRIYHVSSSINNPYSDNGYSSFTDYNNTNTKFSLIKLVEADGETKFKSTDGYAVASDLWQAGAKLSDKFPNYTRNDGKALCFDIEIVSVSATEATITITFA